ncbi:hypothetical protein AX15_002841 [Amanita polypyramis BW_CC]|nr:hypothetical protein AX15_002841 [Amanita polypyramis BW_CC]
MERKTMFDVANTLGAVLIGSFAAAGLSGIVTAQTFLYFKLYPSDRTSLKCLALSIWVLDMAHTALLGRTVWHGLIAHFGAAEKANTLPWTLAFSVADTAILTIVVQCFFVYRIHILTEQNYFISVPLALLAVSRLAFACVATVQMITLQLLPKFVKKYTWTFTMDLVISAFMDILITISLCYLLRKQKKYMSRMDHILNSLILYTFETGALTCIATIVVLIFWLTMPTNFIFMSLYFVIIKLYANSLLATLNSRKVLQKSSGGNIMITVETRKDQVIDVLPCETSSSKAGSIRKRSSESQA